MTRIPQLDGIRGIAILSVFLHHALNAKLMWMGVDLFFVLSGFLITSVLLSMKDKSIEEFFGHFYGRRVRRIVPPYVVTVCLVTVLFGKAWTHEWYLYFGGMNFMELVPKNHMPLSFGPLWSLAVEEQFYFIWPFVVFFLPVRKIKFAAMALILTAPALRGIFHFSNVWPIYMLTPFRMDLLFSEALLSTIYQSRKTLFERYGLGAGASFVLVGLIGLVVLSRHGISTYANTRTSNSTVFECSLFIVVGVMLWSLSGQGVFLLKNAALRFIGRISYTMYLIHLVALQLLRPRFSSYALAVTAFVVTVIYATISWYFLEKPILGLKFPSSARTTAPLAARAN